MNPLSIITLGSGFVYLLAGLALRFFPPKEINALYGYRTGSSMLNSETWKMANQFAAKLLMFLGAGLIATGFVAFWLPPAPFTGMLTGLLVMVLGVVLVIYFTEQHLKKHFDEHGNRRN
jgi:uncharacterized membrane protein